MADVNEKTAKQWKEKAKNSRLLASKISHLEAKGLYLRLAQEYETMAVAATNITRQQELLRAFRVQTQSILNREGVD